MTKTEMLIKELESHLSTIACEWRKLPPEEDLKAQSYVEEYQKVFLQLWELGWDGMYLSVDDQLPDRYMPKYFLEKWGMK